ncbi:MAG TPA: serine/threonine-protein kinase [Terriglobales bacterium]
MSNKIGRFEIVNEINHSDRVSVYKVVDSETEGAKPIILKTLQLDSFGEQATAMVENLTQESEAGKKLKSQNIGGLLEAGVIDGKFCAQMEYVEGNSVATMIARKEGFSIWDVMDITRQACQGLDFAHSKELAHYTLEPAKIMVAWDGTVKVLSFGVSTMSAWAAQANGAPPEVLFYMSPEQLAGDPVDARSNLFSIGAILYEMVTERKPFDGDDAAGVRQAIIELAPVPPDQINVKLHPVLSHVIMKALAKDPQERYASGAELIKELDRCRENAAKAAAKPAAAPAAAPAKKARIAPPAGFIQPESYTAPSEAAAPAPVAKPERKPVVKSEPAAAAPEVEAPQVHRAAKAAAASAFAGASLSNQSASSQPASELEVDWQPQAKTPVSSVVKQEPELMSAFVAEEPEVKAPKIAVDPLMGGGAQKGDAKTLSFSEIDELPPLKEIKIAPPPPPPPAAEPDPVVKAMLTKQVEEEKPKIQVKEVAKKAVTEVKKTPPHLFVYSIAGAVAVILIIVGTMAYHYHSENEDDIAPAAAPATTAATTPAPEAAPAPAPAQAAPAAAPEAQAANAPPAAQEQQTVVVSEKPKAGSKKKTKATAPVAATTVATGDVNISSNPSGAQIQIDGHSDPSWVTPYEMSALIPGQHNVVISKPGFSTDSRSFDVSAGSKSFLSVQLAPLTGTLSVNSDPQGAEIWMDGKDTGKTTPAQFTVDKAGAHSFTFKKGNYLDESTSANVAIGTTSHVSATMRALGNTDDIKMGGKFKKVFGGGDVTGMGSVSVKTTPKGAQVSVNQRMLDKTSPMEFYLDPGNYELDITLSGYKSIHRVISIDKGGKVAIDESLDRQ